MYLPANLRRKASARARCYPIGGWGGTFCVSAPGQPDLRRSEDGGVRRAPGSWPPGPGRASRERLVICAAACEVSGEGRRPPGIGQAGGAAGDWVATSLRLEPAGPGPHRAVVWQPRRGGSRCLRVCGRDLPSPALHALLCALLCGHGGLTAGSPRLRSSGLCEQLCSHPFIFGRISPYCFLTSPVLPTNVELDSRCWK